MIDYILLISLCRLIITKIKYKIIKKSEIDVLIFRLRAIGKSSMRFFELVFLEQHLHLVWQFLLLKKKSIKTLFSLESYEIKGLLI
ncbi:hypothetical protein BpHYR1_015074 [Brachionus plicatilis]|uniref:Uncharacterized protein n=1 Tax=Brachionus plicatilis TaxID=10195 RepID=A0A3M7SMW4_BRAPC|nr:hypothetical protein BpHYR1_015074 [Brachionus plicatilis]